MKLTRLHRGYAYEHLEQKRGNVILKDCLSVTYENIVQTVFRVAPAKSAFQICKILVKTTILGLFYS